MAIISVPVILRVDVESQYADAVRNSLADVIEYGSVRDSISQALWNAKPDGSLWDESPSIDALYVPKPGDVPTPNILRLLDLSTKHLPYEVCQDLNDYPGVIADKREFGWFVWVPEDIDTHIGEIDAEDPEHPIPAEIVTIWRYAQQHDCQYVLFDRDAQVNPDLPTWRW